MKNRFLFFLLLFAMLKVSSQESYLVVGTYTGGKSKGIYVYRFNSANGTAAAVDSIVVENPSFLAISPNEKFVYAVEELADQKGNGGWITAFSFDKKTGRLTRLNQQLSGGDHPCYVAVDKTGKWVAVGNYTSGSLAILPIKKDGSLDSAHQVIRHEGHSVDNERQKGPHVHSTMFSPDNKFLLVPDLGIDKVMVYAFNSKTGELTPATPVEVEPGNGPRHLAFDPAGKYVYLAEEMSGTVAAFKYDKGALEYFQGISALPPEYSGPAGGADIHVSPDGKFLYSSTRGNANNLAIFSIQPKTGMLTKTGDQSTLGKNPRNFNFDPTGNFILVGNQSSDEIVIFKRNKQTGELSDTGNRINVGKPVCIKWANIK